MAKGMFTQLMDASDKAQRARAPTTRPRQEAEPHTKNKAQASKPREDLSTTPYISQNYRFTEDELRWLRRQAYNLTERLGGKVSQNTVLRVALQHLRDACSANPKRNPLVDAISRLKK